MQKIVLCVYYGMCDSQRNIVGHLGKVTKEYCELLKESFDIYLMASPCIYDKISEECKVKGKSLEYDVLVDEPFTLKKRVSDKVKIMKNIRQCVRDSDINTLFFYQVDFFFFLYIFLFYKKGRKRLFCLVYHQNFTGGIFEKYLNYIYQKALLKIDGIVYTQKEQAIAHENKLWLPDYLYDEDYYSRFDRKQKINKVVCLGTMNRYKQLEELVNVFKNIDIPLEICGRFDDKERYRRLTEMKNDNITISDCILSEEEYYRKLGESKYSVLPYDMQQYIARTSGVLLESIYVGCIPIAPIMLLEQNKIPGYKYDELHTLRNFNKSYMLQRSSVEEILQQNSKKMKEYELKSFFIEENIPRKS